MEPTRWVDVAAEADVPVGSAELVRHEGRQIAVFRVDDAQLYAVDNLCPHEGYPLLQGRVRDCVLTCAWHNYKFDLRTGRCVQGDEDVERYDVRVRAGRIEVQVARAGDADVERTWGSLAAAMIEDDKARMARDGMRLLTAGVDPSDLLLAAVRFDAERGEYGSGHALAVCADLLGWVGAPELGVESRLLAIVYGLACATESNARRAPRPTPDPREAAPAAKADAIEGVLRQWVEDEDAAGAEALLRTALAGGAPAVDVQAWFLALCSDHLLDFGHSMIYTTKAFDLLAQVGWRWAPAVLPALLFKIVTGTREDTLPPMRAVAEHIDTVAGDWPTWRSQAGALAAADREALRHALLEGRAREAAAAISSALRAGGDPVAVSDAIVSAAAERMLRFDVEIDRDPTVQEGWLDVTHAFTYAHAVRIALQRDPRPTALRSLYFAAHFVQRCRPLDAPADQRAPWSVVPGDASTPDAVVAAIEARDAAAAVTRAAAVLTAGGATPLDHALRALVLAAPGTRAIFVAHAIKLTVAAFEARAAVPEAGDRDLPVLAVVRFLASPPQEQAAPRWAHEAVRFIGERKPPRRLT